MNRLAIYVIYDRDGIIDDYILYYLNELSKNTSHIVIVCNGILSDNGRTKLQKITKDVFVRPNTGLDAGAIKDVLLNLYGWRNVYQYDELIIANDTVYGPFFAFEYVFKEMCGKDCDFWGITEYYETSRHPSHIQSYFIYIKNKLLKSVDFKIFWDDYIPSDDYGTTVRNYEVKFSQFFSALGYKYSAYLNTESIYTGGVHENTNYNLIDYANYLIQLNCPLIKKRSLGDKSINALTHTPFYNEKSNQIVKYIQEKTNYPINFLWDNLLRNYNIAIIKNSLCLEYILPSQISDFQPEQHKPRSMIVIAHLPYEESISECLNYLDNVPAYADIVVTTSKNKIVEQVSSHFDFYGKKNLEVRLLPNKGSHVAALLVSCHDLLLKYEYLCFIHDSQSEIKRDGQVLRYSLWENTLSSAAYIENIMRKFTDNSRMGLLVAPTSYLGKVCNNAPESPWQHNFDITKQLSEKLSLTSPLSEEIKPFSENMAFWCRTIALKKLFEHNFCLGDFVEKPTLLGGTLSHAVERILPYVAQHERFYSGIVMSDRYAEIRMLNFENKIELLNSDPLINPLCSNVLKALFERYKEWSYVYLYGTGLIAYRIYIILEHFGINFHGFIVSDGQKKDPKWNKKGVYWLSEIDTAQNNFGIILALNKKNTDKVVSLLEAKKVTNYIRIYN